ncbi:hypothetical protein ONZ45_g4921 [Pleurotus djamor]|nr:hypothetical protein ONZ45_g4921 [Pleurotus djamor]
MLSIAEPKGLHAIAFQGTCCARAQLHHDSSAPLGLIKCNSYVPPKSASSSVPTPRRSQRRLRGTPSILSKSRSQPVQDETPTSDGEAADIEDDGETSNQDSDDQDEPTITTSSSTTEDYVDSTPKAVKEKAAQVKRRQQAIRSCQLVLRSLEKGSTKFTDSEFAALKVVNEFVEQSVVSLSFSRVQKRHLDDLGFTRGHIEISDVVLRDRASKRESSERFKQTQERMQAIGSSTKERLCEYVCFDYVLESMSNPNELHDTSQWAPKCSPQMEFEHHIYKQGDTRYGFNGVVDMVPFVIKEESKLCDHDLRTLAKLSHVQVDRNSIVPIEIKRHDADTFDDNHVSEGVAQAMNVNAVLEGVPLQKFVLTDGKQWKFCLLDEKSNKYLLSNTLKLAMSSGANVLNFINKIWEDPKRSSDKGLWYYPS